MSDEASKSAGPRSVLRVLEILQRVATSQGGMSLTELTAQLELPKTSAFSLLKALESGDYLAQRGSRYVLGLQAVKLGVVLNQPHAFKFQARPILEWLAQESSETALLCIPSVEGGEIIYIDVIESEAPLRFSVRPGNRRPFYCAASGKAVLAFLPDEVQQRYLSETGFVKFTSDTSGREELEKLLPDVRRDGVVVDVNGIIDGAAGIASPGFDSRGRVTCAISVAGPTARMQSEQSRLKELTIQAAIQLSAIMGFEGSYPPKP